jgi:hypothetical protein
MIQWLREVQSSVGIYKQPGQNVPPDSGAFPTLDKAQSSVARQCKYGTNASGNDDAREKKSGYDFVANMASHAICSEFDFGDS